MKKMHTLLLVIRYLFFVFVDDTGGTNRPHRLKRMAILIGGGATHRRRNTLLTQVFRNY